MNNSFVLGIDPGKSFFVATLLDATGTRIWKAKQFAMTRAGLEALVCHLPPGDITVGVEASGRIDDNVLAYLRQWALACRGRRVKVIRINPAQSARFGGPKPRRDQTDGSDSEHIAEYTRVYAHRLEAFDTDPSAQAMVRLIGERQRLIEEVAAIKNRIHEQLLVCFPEFTQVFPDPFAQLAVTLLRRAPTARHAARRRPLSLARVKSERRGGSLGIERAQKLVSLAQRSIASATSDQDAEALVFLLDQLELLHKRVTSIEKALADYVRQGKGASPSSGADGVSAARQIELLDSLPGMGLVAAASLVLGSRGITRFCSGKAMAAQWASCPERMQTGTSLNKTRLTARGDHKRRAMLYLSTQVACMYDPAFAFHKWRMMQKGLCPQQAVCAAMNRMARVAWALAAKNETYDVHRMLEQIERHHPGLWKTFVRLHQNDPKLAQKLQSWARKIA